MTAGTGRRELIASALGAACAAAAGRFGGGGTLLGGLLAPGRADRAAGGSSPAPHRARWWTPLPDKGVACGLCPNACAIGDGERGRCRVRENRGGVLFALGHSRPCTVALDPVEKKPFFHVLPGASALSLATPGCSFECRWCQNWEISQARPEDVPASTLVPADVARLATERGARLVACTYTEPVVWSEYVLDVAVAARGRGLKTLVVSNGSIREAPLRDLCAAIAGYKVDLKAFSERTYREMCRGELKPVLDTLKRLAKTSVWTEIVVLLIPTVNDSEAEVRNLARFVKGEVGAATPVHFTRFHPAYRLSNLPPTPVATLERARDVALAEGLDFVYLGNVPGHPGESTYCPGCHTRLVRRVGMATVENRLKDGACPGCGRAIPGVWS